MDSTGPDDNHKPENSHNSKDGHRDQSIYGEPSEQNAGGLLTGCVLASSPSFSDPDLDHSVCLIIEQNDEVTVGVFLNRPIMVDPKPFWNLLMDEGTIEAKSGGHFNFGGPNNGPILAIHSNSELAEGGNDQGVYLSAQAEILKKLAVVESEHLRWVIGNATWEKGDPRHTPTASRSTQQLKPNGKEQRNFGPRGSLRKRTTSPSLPDFLAEG